MKLCAVFNQPKLDVCLKGQSLEISTGKPIIRDNSEFPVYDGAYEVTPTRETQTLQTQGKALVGNVVVNPIPSNYGLITYNGSVLTVS